MAIWTYIVGAVIVYVLLGLRVVNQYERGVKFTLGKFSGIMNPGLRIIFPIIQTWQKLDLRVKVLDVPSQDTITKDNVSVKVNAVIYYRVHSSEKAILEVENYNYAISQLAQTSMRNIVGEVALDELLSKREEISVRIQKIVDRESDPWGIKVSNVDVKDIELPQDMQRVIAKQAEAERERRAVIIKAEGEVMAATNMAKAAKTLSAADGALHLRTLQTLNDISSDESNTIVLALPLEVLRAFERHKK